MSSTRAIYTYKYRFIIYESALVVKLTLLADNHALL